MTEKATSLHPFRRLRSFVFATVVVTPSKPSNP
jgi:hypothetical protein